MQEAKHQTLTCLARLHQKITAPNSLETIDQHETNFQQCSYIILAPEPQPETMRILPNHTYTYSILTDLFFRNHRFWGKILMSISHPAAGNGAVCPFLIQAKMQQCRKDFFVFCLTSNTWFLESFPEPHSSRNSTIFELVPRTSAPGWFLRVGLVCCFKLFNPIWVHSGLFCWKSRKIEFFCSWTEIIGNFYRFSWFRKSAWYRPTIRFWFWMPEFFPEFEIQRNSQRRWRENDRMFWLTVKMLTEMMTLRWKPVCAAEYETISC